MSKIDREAIICPALQAAYERAMKNAFDKGRMPSDVSWPSKYGNHVSVKGMVEGTDACLECGKKIEVDLHLNQIDGAHDEERHLVKVYDVLDFQTSIKVSGVECTKKKGQK